MQNTKMTDTESEEVDQSETQNNDHNIQVPHDLSTMRWCQNPDMAESQIIVINQENQIKKSSSHKRTESTVALHYHNCAAPARSESILSSVTASAESNPKFAT